MCHRPRGEDSRQFPRNQNKRGAALNGQPRGDVRIRKNEKHIQILRHKNHRCRYSTFHQRQSHQPCTVRLHKFHPTRSKQESATAPTFYMPSSVHPFRPKYDCCLITSREWRSSYFGHTNREQELTDKKVTTVRRRTGERPDGRCLKRRTCMCMEG